MTKVLIAEDNEMLLEDIALELEMRGYDVVQASNGNLALHHLKTAQKLPDIIVSDIAMPDMDGFKFLEHVRNVSEWIAIPFLFLTAFDSPNSVRISKELGVDDYITKPFRAEDLVLAMESKLKRVKAFEAQADQNLDVKRKTLLHMMSHELKTPLMSIYGGSELLAESLAETSDETVHKMLDLIRDGANRLNNFTGKAIALIEVDSGNLHKLHGEVKREHNLVKVIKVALVTVQQEITVNERDVKICLHEPAQDYSSVGIFEYMVMMLEELLRNAVAVTPDGGEVHVSIETAKDSAIICIVDQGHGIQEDDLSRVWDRFVQIGRDVHEQQGSGLGLPIVRDVARIHGGDCTITSKPGEGTTVRLSLPLVK